MKIIHQFHIYLGHHFSSDQTSTQLYSFADPAMESLSTFKAPHFHHRKSGVDVAFDGRIYQFNDTKINSFVHQEQIAEASDFVHFVEALERKTMPIFVNEKLKKVTIKPKKNYGKFVYLL